MPTIGRTTFRLDDDLLNEAKLEARRRGETLTSLMEQGLRLVLANRRKPTRQRRRLPVSSATGGVRPGVDISNTADLLDRLDGLK
jgi:hypothetical protein